MKILLSAYTGLGNFVLKTPMIKRLKELYPDAVLDLIGGNGFGTTHLLQNTPLIRKTHILKPEVGAWKKWRFFWQLRQEQYDLILLPFDTNKNFLLLGSYLAGIKKRIRHIDIQGHGWGKRITLFRKFIFYPHTIFVPMLPSRHEIDLNYDLLETLYNQAFERHYATFVEPPPDNFVVKTLNRFNLQKSDYLLLQITAANGQNLVKTWHPDNFVKLIQRLSKQRPNLPIVLVGDQGDYSTVIQKIEHHWAGSTQVINTAGKTSIAELIAIIAASRLVICHDSGVMHLADALHTPLIALYGPTDYTRTRPLKSNSHILYSKTPHFAAMYNFKTTESALTQAGIGHEAMAGITLDRIVEKINQILEKQ